MKVQIIILTMIFCISCTKKKLHPKNNKQNNHTKSRKQNNHTNTPDNPSPNPTNEPVSVLKLKSYLTDCPEIITKNMNHLYGDRDILPYVCGEIQVPLFHEKKSLQKIGLEFIYFYPSEGDGLNPVVMTQGGPGGSSIELLLNTYNYWKKIIKKHGLFVYEYRGTDFSDPNMKCQFEELDEYDIDDYEKKSIDCVNYWNDKFDTTAITTTQIAHDLAFITQKVGLSKIHYYGVSFGTLVGQYLARMHPDIIKSMVFDGVIPYGVDWNRYSNKMPFYDSLKNLEKSCKQDVYCKNIYGPLGNKFKKAKEYLKKNPIKKFDYEINNEIFNEYITQNMTEYEKLGELYRLISKWEKPLILKEHVEPDLEDTIDVVYMSVYCHERTLSIQKFGQAKKEKDKMHQKANDSFERICKHWVPEETKLDWMELSETAKNIPVLLLSGEYDPVTPPRYAEKIKKDFKNSIHHIIKGYSHSVFLNSECMGDAVYSFISNPDLKSHKNCDIKTNFLPNFEGSERNLLSPSEFNIVFNDWKLSNQSLKKDSEIVTFTDHSFVGDPDEIFWLFRKNISESDSSLKKNTLKVKDREWKIVSGPLGDELKKTLTMAFIPCGNSWFSVNHEGNPKNSSAIFKEIISLLENDNRLCYLN